MQENPGSRRFQENPLFKKNPCLKKPLVSTSGLYQRDHSRPDGEPPRRSNNRSYTIPHAAYYTTDLWRGDGVRVCARARVCAWSVWCVCGVCVARA